GQLSLMHKIARTGACPVGDVAKQFDVTSAAASQMLDRLVQLGFVQRSEDAGDRRVRLHQLSQKGEDLVRASAHARTKWVDGLISPLTDDQLDKLLPALEILSARIQEFAPHGAHVPFASPAEPAPGNATARHETSAPETEFAP